MSERARLVELCLRLAARYESAFDDIERLADALQWSVRRDEGLVYVEGEVTSALPLGQGPITNAVIINFLLYGAYCPFLEEATGLLDDVNKVWAAR